MATTIKWPVIDTLDPSPLDPCRDIPRRGNAVQRIGLAFTPPEPEDSLRCHFDAGNCQMAVEAFVWRTYEQTLPPDLHAGQSAARPRARAVLQVHQGV